MDSSEKAKKLQDQISFGSIKRLLITVLEPLSVKAERTAGLQH